MVIAADGILLPAASFPGGDYEPPHTRMQIRAVGDNHVMVCRNALRYPSKSQVSCKGAKEMRSPAV
jgi:hypothetical protein